MTEEEKWKYIVSLDDELLIGCVTLSEWSTFIVKDADTAFACGANLAAIITAMAGVESHLKYVGRNNYKARLSELINEASIDDELRAELHNIRKYRNKWVHVKDPDNDVDLLEYPGKHEDELEIMASRAIKALRRIIYSEQGL